jgi:predicted metal-dependent hydrolase
MCSKWIKRSLIAAAAFLVIGGLLFGKDLVSYVKSSTNLARETVKDSVPIEFELRRAQDLLEEILPEIHANIRMIAQEEVELANLKQEIEESRKALEQQRRRVETLRSTLAGQGDSFTFGGRNYTRQEVTDELAAQFENLREAELVLAGKDKLLENREASLKAGMTMLEKTKGRKRILAAKIEALESKHRLLKAAAVGSGVQVDNSKLAQTEKLIEEIRKRLEVAERVLAHESKFTQAIPVEQVSEQDLVSEVDKYLADNPQPAQP